LAGAGVVVVVVVLMKEVGVVDEVGGGE